MVFDTVKLALWGAIALAIAAHWGHYKYLSHRVDTLKTDIAVLKSKHAERENQFAQALKDWTLQVEKRSKELDKARKDKKETVEKHRRELDEIFKGHSEVRKELNVLIEEMVAATEKVFGGSAPVITAPAYFRMFYDLTAVDIAEAPPGVTTLRLPADPGGAASKTETFDAAATTKIVSENNLQCREDQTRLNKLIDVVEELERKNHERRNASRLDGEIKTN